MSNKSWGYLIKNDLEFNSKWELNTNPVYGRTFIQKGSIQVVTPNSNKKVSRIKKTGETASNEQFIDKEQSESLIGNILINNNTGEVYKIHSLLNSGFPRCYNATNRNGDHAWLSVSEILQSIELNNLHWQIVED